MTIPENMICYDQVQRLQEAVVDAFCDLVMDTLERSTTFRVSLSGGSTPKGIYQLISQRNLPWERIHWFWGDERNVPHDHRDSNAKMVFEALLNHIDPPAANVHTVPVDVDDPASAAEVYEQILRRQFPDDPFPRWDLNLLGLGDDAHTASLFPETKALQEKDRWFVENWVPKVDAFRYTLTSPAINSSRQIWFLIAGANKKAALRNVISPDQNPNRFPSQLIHPDRWFVTSDAID